MTTLNAWRTGITSALIMCTIYSLFVGALMWISYGPNLGFSIFATIAITLDLILAIALVMASRP